MMGRQSACSFGVKSSIDLPAYSLDQSFTCRHALYRDTHPTVPAIDTGTYFPFFCSMKMLSCDIDLKSTRGQSLPSHHVNKLIANIILTSLQSTPERSSVPLNTPARSPHPNQASISFQSQERTLTHWLTNTRRTDHGAKLPRQIPLGTLNHCADSSETHFEQSRLGLYAAPSLPWPM